MGVALVIHQPVTLLAGLNASPFLIGETTGFKIELNGCHGTGWLFPVLTYCAQYQTCLGKAGKMVHSFWIDHTAGAACGGDQGCFANQ